MRVSARKDSPHYLGALLKSTYISVDDLVVEMCAEADTDEGWADIVLTDDAGNVVEVPGQQCAAMYRLTGHVQVHRGRPDDHPSRIDA